MANTRYRVRHAHCGATPTGLHDLSDASLVEAIAGHDHAAFAEAYARHGARVHAVARAVCGSVRADDLTQEVFVRLWNEPHRYDRDRGTLRSYLLVQAHCRAVDLLRSDNARAGRETREGSLPTIDLVSTEANALALVERTEVSALVDVLPKRERHPIVLAYFGGHTYRDNARILGVPEGTIKRRIRSGLKRLRAESEAARDLT